MIFEKREPAGSILCFGDSLTIGTPGISYLRYLHNRNQYKNLGVGGDTLTGMTERIQSSLADPDTQEFIIGIGTNDILLPHMEKRSEQWNTAVELMVKLGKVILRDIGEFETAYASLLDQVIAAGKTVTIFGMPVIGEDLDSDLNKLADVYNLLICRLCQERDIPFVDFKYLQKRKIEQHGGHNPYLLSDHPGTAIGDTLWTTLLPFTERVSKKRGLIMTVDGVHLNRSSAKLLARMLEKARKERHKRRNPKVTVASKRS